MLKLGFVRAGVVGRALQYLPYRSRRAFLAHRRGRDRAPPPKDSASAAGLKMLCTTASYGYAISPWRNRAIFLGFGIDEEELLSQRHKAEGVAGSVQKLCGDPQAGGAAGRSAVQRPSGARNAGQPSTWNRRSANRKRWARIHPMDCSMPSARRTKAGAAVGAAKGPTERTVPLRERQEIQEMLRRLNA